MRRLARDEDFSVIHGQMPPSWRKKTARKRRLRAERKAVAQGVRVAPKTSALT